MMNQQAHPDAGFQGLLTRGWKEDEHHQLLGLIFILNGLDAIATIAWLQLGIAREANPFMDQLSSKLIMTIQFSLIYPILKTNLK